MQDQLAAAHNRQEQNAAQAQEVTRLQHQVADLPAEIANQAGIKPIHHTVTQNALYSAMHVPQLHRITITATRETVVMQRHDAWQQS